MLWKDCPTGVERTQGPTATRTVHLNYHHYVDAACPTDIFSPTTVNIHRLQCQVNTSLTLVLIATKAGTVPIGVSLHDSQTEASYNTVFSQNIKTPMPLHQFCVGDGSRNVRNSRAIHVQPTSVGRRREGASRGSARHRSGRTLATVAYQKHLALKRHRSLSVPIDQKPKDMVMHVSATALSVYFENC